MGDKEAVGLERRRHGGGRRGGSPADAGVRGFWGLQMRSGRGKVRGFGIGMGVYDGWIGATWNEK